MLMTECYYQPELGIFYQHLNDEDPVPLGYEVFTYRWRHISSGATGTRRIIITGNKQETLSSLLTIWTNENWEYTHE